MSRWTTKKTKGVSEAIMLTVMKMMTPCVFGQAKRRDGTHGSYVVVGVVEVAVVVMEVVWW